MEYCFYSRQSQQRNQSFFVAISADQAFYVSPQLEPIVPVGGPMLLPRLHRIVFKSFGRRVVLFFFSKKSPSAAPRRWHSYLLKVRGNGRQAVFGGRSVVIPS